MSTATEPTTSTQSSTASRAQAPPDAAKSDGDGFGAFLREIMAALISVVIVSMSCYFLVDTYSTAKQEMSVTAKEGFDQKTLEKQVQEKKDAYGRQKDILLYALALLGTVTGYYLGRVPAELSARRADQNSKQAQNSLAANQSVLASSQAAKETITKQRDEAKEETSRLKKDVVQTLLKSKQLISAKTGPQRKTLGAHTSEEDAALLDAESQIDSLLQRLQ